MSVKAFVVKLFLKGKLPSFVYRMAGRKLAKIVKLEGGMETKKLWQSKTVWTAVIGVLLGAIQPISSALGHPIDVPAWAYEVLAGFGLYSLRVGDKKIG